MRTIGLIHGMSAVSTVDFYQRLHVKVGALLGGHQQPEILLSSVNFAVIERCVRTRAWTELDEYLAAKAVALEHAGAGFLAIGSNTGHVAAAAVEAATSLPFLHIADSVADAAEELGASTLGLIGTRPVMEGDTYRGRLAHRGLKLLTPAPEVREVVHRMVFEELTRDIFTESSRARLLGVIDELQAEGADAVILGCTEFSLLVGETEVSGIPLLDTTELHADAVVHAAVST